MVGKTCNLPTSCPCGSKFDIRHSMSYKKGGFICIRHNDLRDQTANMMSEKCKDTEIEPELTPSPGEEMQDRTSNNSRGRYQDSRFLGTMATGIFRPWVFDPNVCRYRNKSLQQCYVMNEHEKKRAYNEGIL